MQTKVPLHAFAPLFDPEPYTAEQRHLLQPFFTNLDQSVYVPLVGSPEVIGALCSRTSRASGDLRTVFLNEYITPFLQDTEDDYGKSLQAFITFLHKHPIEKIFSNPRARSFYAKWLAQYGDDSIAQMAGMHLVYAGLSQVAIKHFQDQRIGLAPIEKSTRYVDYSSRMRGQYRYYTDPTLSKLGLEQQYRTAMDLLFATYTTLLPKLVRWLNERFPEEKKSVIEKKAFDTLRGLLPTATLSQVAFFGNGQAFEYLISRSLRHVLGELRWASDRAYEELFAVTPSFLRRIKDPEKQELVSAYQDYLSGKGQRLTPLVDELMPQTQETAHDTRVTLLEYDPDGEHKIVAGMLFAAPNNHASWQHTLTRVRSLSRADKQRIIDAYFFGRSERWQKVGRALENTYVRFEVIMNIGAWRDVHRHRMLTHQRQLFTIKHGYDIPPEVVEAGLEDSFRTAIERTEAVHEAIAKHDPILAQYAVTFAHRLRFMQWENLRECFWEIELRTIPEGHPDYRHIEQAKFKLLEKHFPLLSRYMRVNLGEYDFARRGQEEKIQQKLHELVRVSS